MISHLVDADRIIDYLNDRGGARESMGTLIQARTLATSIIVVGELYEGLAGTASEAQKRSSLDELLAGLTVLGIDDDTASVFGRLRAELRVAGQLIADHDLWIAATALRHDLTLISRDAHFERIADLKRMP